MIDCTVLCGPSRRNKRIMEASAGKCIHLLLPHRLYIPPSPPADFAWFTRKGTTVTLLCLDHIALSSRFDN